MSQDASIARVMPPELADEMRERVAHNRAIFEELAGRAARARDLPAIAAWASTAGQCATLGHIGRLASRELEAALGRASSRLARPSPPSAAGGVLHVVTQAYPTGGHTRLVWRWIAADARRRHSVVLTRQQSEPVPAELAQAAERSGGRLVDFDPTPWTLRERAERLRALAAGCEAVVLHTHAFDVVPTLAFAGWREAPPVIVSNHADHAFWFGVGASRVVAHIRASGEALSLARRGLPPSRSVLLPLPLVVEPRARTRADAKRALGLDEASRVILSIASEHKFRPIGAIDFLAALRPTLERDPRAVLVVVGPRDQGDFARAREETGGRVRAMGRRTDLADFYLAADVYVDSMPFGSQTSLLEAASCGTPVVTYNPARATLGTLTADDPAFADDVYVDTLDALTERIGQLLAAAGPPDEGLIEAVRRVHTGAGWAEAVERVYEAARAAPPPALPEPVDERAPDLFDLMISRYNESRFDRATVVGAWMGELPLGDRLRAWLWLRRQRGGADPKALFASSTRIRLHQLRRRLGR